MESGERGAACAARRRVARSDEVDVRALFGTLGLAAVVVEMLEGGIMVVRRLGGWSVQPGEMKTWRPRWMETVCVCGVGVGLPVDGSRAGLVEDDAAGCWRTRSPRMMTSCWITDLPARIMCWVAWSWARREILLPLSCQGDGG